MNKYVNTAIWIVLFIFLLPSSLAVASWNSLPGSRLFAVKLWMEQALVAVTPSASARGDLQIAYTERRFSEAKRLLADKTSIQGLEYLNTQVDTTKQAILATSDPAVKKQLAQKYITSLRDVSNQLEQEKQVARASAPSRPAAKPKLTTAQTQQFANPPPGTTPVVQTVVVNNIVQTVIVYVTPAPTQTGGTNPQPTATPTPPPQQSSAGLTPEDTISAIDDSQQTISETIEEIAQGADVAPVITPAPTPTATPVPPTPTPTPGQNHGQGQGQGGGQGQGQGNNRDD